MNSEITKLYNKIYEYRINNKKYSLNQTILEYINKGYSVYDDLLNIYIINLINLNRYEEAKKYIDILCKYFPDSFSIAHKIKLYVSCNCIDIAYELLAENYDSLNSEELFTIGKKFMLNGCYTVANYCYQKALILMDDKNLIPYIKEDIEKINNYFENNAFIEKDYRYFKESGDSLHEGLIIRGIVEKNDKTEDKQKFNKRKHLIIAINEDKIYCVPVLYNLPDLNNENFIKYILCEEDYPESKGNRYVINKIECIKEENVYRVSGEVSSRDFKNIYKMVTGSRKSYIKVRNLFKIKK